ncbi:MAG: NYN domain-containing protein [Planctomycetes bacterium]|nr:NYN domain-containing protein [Planctomycetota bacterium]
MSDFGSDIFDDNKTPHGRGKASETADEPATLADAAPKKKARRRRAKPADEESAATVEETTGDVTPTDDTPADESPAPARRKRSRKKPASKQTTDEPDADSGAEVAEREADVEESTEADSDAEVPRRSRRRRGRGSDAVDESEDNFDDEVEASEPESTDGDDGAESEEFADDDRPSGRRSRRRRRSRRNKGNGDDESRGSDERRPRNREERGRRRGSTPAPSQHWTERREGFPTVPGQRLAVFVDLDRLVAESADRDGEIAFTKLKTTLGGKRNMIRAVAYGSAESTPMLEGPVRQAGFEVRAVRDRSELSVALAVDAMAIGPRVDCVVVAPVSAEFGPLASALRTLGIRVESAGFGEPREDADLEVVDHQELGTECMFVP